MATCFGKIGAMHLEARELRVVAETCADSHRIGGKDRKEGYKIVIGLTASDNIVGWFGPYRNR